LRQPMCIKRETLEKREIADKWREEPAPTSMQDQIKNNHVRHPAQAPMQATTADVPPILSGADAIPYQRKMPSEFLVAGYTKTCIQ